MVVIISGGGCENCSSGSSGSVRISFLDYAYVLMVVVIGIFSAVGDGRGSDCGSNIGGGATSRGDVGGGGIGDGGGDGRDIGGDVGDDSGGGIGGGDR